MFTLIRPDEDTRRLFTEKGMIQNGQKQGLWKIYHKNGQLKAEGAYLKDLQDESRRKATMKTASYNRKAIP